MKLSDSIKKGIACPQCKGHMIREHNFDLPAGYVEFYCINCGKRIWYDKEVLKYPISLN